MICKIYFYYTQNPCVAFTFFIDPMLFNAKIFSGTSVCKTIMSIDKSSA